MTRPMVICDIQEEKTRLFNTVGGPLLVSNIAVVFRIDRTNVRDPEIERPLEQEP